ncbi:MAG: ABC transporter permease [Pirellulaceae bacterium]
MRINHRASERFVQAMRDGNVSLTMKETDRESAVAAVRRGAISRAIIISEGFGESIGLFTTGQSPSVEIAVDPSRTAEAGLMQGMLLQAAGETIFGGMQDPTQMRDLMERSREQLSQSENVPLPLRLALNAVYGSLDSLADEIEQQQEENATDDATASTEARPRTQLLEIKRISLQRSRGLVDRLRSGWDLSIPAASLWAVLGCVATFAQSLVRERTRGTLLRLRIAPLARWQLLGGKAVACWVMAMGVMSAMMLVGVLLGMRPKDPMQLVVSMAFVAWAFVGVMMAMSVVGRTEEAVAGAGWGANVIMAMVGGGMVPLAFLPSWMQSISHFSPVKWGVLSLEGAVWRELTWSEALQPWGILCLIGLLGFAVGVWRLARLDRAD